MVPENLGERVNVDNLAFHHDAGRKRRDSGTLDGNAARAALNGCYIAGLDVEPNYRTVL